MGRLSTIRSVCSTSRKIRSIVCVGWRYLIPPPVIEHLDGEVLVLHDSLLPRLRGFAPLVTAMIVGDQEAGVTLLRVGQAVDDGPILWQRRVPILPSDTISELVRRVSPLCAEAVCDTCAVSHSFHASKMKERRPTAYRAMQRTIASTGINRPRKSSGQFGPWAHPTWPRQTFLAGEGPIVVETATRCQTCGTPSAIRAKSQRSIRRAGPRLSAVAGS